VDFDAEEREFICHKITKKTYKIILNINAARSAEDVINYG